MEQKTNLFFVDSTGEVTDGVGEDTNDDPPVRVCHDFSVIVICMWEVVGWMITCPKRKGTQEMRKRMLRENTFADAGPILRNAYHWKLKNALEYVRHIKDYLELLDELINGGTTPLGTIVASAEDRKKYSTLDNWTPDIESLSMLEIDLQTAFSELDPLIGEGTHRKIRGLVQEELRRILREDDRDYSPYDRKQGEGDYEYKKRLKAERKKLKDDLDAWEKDDKKARSERGMLTVDTDIKSRQIRVIDDKLSALDKAEPGDQHDKRAPLRKRASNARE